MLDLSHSFSLSFSAYLPTYLSIFYVSIQLSIYLSIYLSLSLSSVYLSSCLPVYLSIYLSLYLPIYLSICLSVCPSIYFSICLSVHLSVYLSIYLIISLFVDIISERPKAARTCSVLYILTWKCASRHGGAHFFNIRTSKSGANMWCFVHFDLLRATTACTFSTSQLPKVVPTWCVLCILTSKCASRHNGVHFFDISTSKSGPSMVCFVHFDLEMCFAPQRRALFRHLNFQKWRVHVVFCTF